MLSPKMSFVKGEKVKLKYSALYCIAVCRSLSLIWSRIVSGRFEFSSDPHFKEVNQLLIICVLFSEIVPPKRLDQAVTVRSDWLAMAIELKILACADVKLIKV